MKNEDDHAAKSYDNSTLEQNRTEQQNASQLFGVRLFKCTQIKPSLSSAFSPYFLSEYLCTHSKNHPISSGLTFGVIPWPKFAIHPPPASFHLALNLSTSFSIPSFPPYNTVGSKFPWRLTFLPTISRTSTGSTVQSRPRVAYPV